MINMEEACFIHMDSKKEDDHLDTVVMLEAKRSRSQKKDNKNRNQDKKIEKSVIMRLAGVATA